MMPENSSNYTLQKDNRMCCCAKQPQIENKDLDRLVKDTSIQLRNLSDTFRAEIEGASSYDIREYFAESHVPFRFEGCPRGSLTCCCSCTRLCNHRCPQDVMHRAYLFCGNILEARTPEERKERYERASSFVQLLYQEMSSESPRYLAIAAMVTEVCTPIFNKQLEQYIKDTRGEDSPYKIDYAPVIVMEEEHITRPNGFVEVRWRKKVDPATGNVLIIEWPRSGICPFCLPTRLVDRRRAGNVKKSRRRYNNEYGTDALAFKK